MSNIRVRFAPSPTGALHIGGLRTALYNYLFAKKNNGTFILRIEDTDQTRYVEGAEDYILEALNWSGLTIDEGPGVGGDYGPYRQSERKDLYKKYAQQLVESGHGYYAFDTPEELDAKREAAKASGNHTFKYDARTRLEMRNSLTLPDSEVRALIEQGVPYVIRLKVPENKEVIIHDLIREEVVFQTNELDDKVMLKADGMPTYHLANIVDDYSMKISHVIRGEEWLPSTGHHVLLYKALGWEARMPQFAHLPLIFKPTGKGKLSKRDGSKFGIPVFPLSWKGDTPEDSFTGFREFGFLPAATINFLALLGWNPGTEQELFSLEELVEAFSIEKIGKSGARFDFEKACWFNQQYIKALSGAELAREVRPLFESKGHHPDPEFLAKICDLLKERVTFLTDFWTMGAFFFEEVTEYEEKMIRKKWKPENQPHFDKLSEILTQMEDFSAPKIEAVVKQFANESGLGFGGVLPFLRLALSGTTQGPSVFDMMALMGKEKVVSRLQKGCAAFNALKAPAS
ncbi:MAG: glutamate--tRNA ligase [Bacteroidetes bacterium]|nr:MAG: glutamate--tRNA ligase [Bacteroidota bacterium]